MTNETQFDAAGNEYVIVEAHGRPGVYHVNRNKWDDHRRCYSGRMRVASDFPSREAADRWVADEIAGR